MFNSLCYVRGMSKKTKTPPTATVEEKKDTVMEVIDVGVTLDELRKKIDKMEVRDSVYWDKFKKQVDEACIYLKVASVHAISILLER